MKVGDNIGLTVAGVNKKAAVPYLLETYGDCIFEAFSQNLDIPCDHTGKLTHVYIDSFQSGTITDYQGRDFTFNEEPPSVYLEKAAYYFDGLKLTYIDHEKGVQYFK